MAHILISLLGDQTVPIVFLMRDEAFAHIDYYIFITTTEMERKNRLNHILNATKLSEEQYKSILVPPEYPSRLISTLKEKLQLDAGNDHFFVNLTGGTKMMAVGLYQFFNQPHFIGKTQMFYKPIGKNAFLRIFPAEQQEEVSLSYQITIKEYLACYGIEAVNFKDDGHLFQATSFTTQFTEYYLQHSNDSDWTGTIANLRNSYNRSKDKKSGDYRLSPNLKQALDTLSYPFASHEEELYQKDVEYLIGGWLEEYVFNSLAQKLNLSSSYIQKGLKIQRQNSKGKMVENEFDVVFVKENTLHIIECKTRINTRLVDDILNKLQALRQEMGLRVKAYLFTSSILKPKTRSRIEKRASLYHIELYDQADFLNNFENFNP